MTEEASAEEPVDENETSTEDEDVTDRDAADDRSAERSTSLEDVPDGAGCTEIWEHLSEQREADAE